MGQAASLQRLNDRLLRIEEEIRTVRDDLETLHRQEATAGALPTVDKAFVQHWADDFFAALGIEGSPLPAEDLQQVLRTSGLAADELSRDLIAARDE